ncbi:hypothetical protein SAMN05443637_11697 [Pseudonocardia thermophila]|uniref:Uncharacterized protein n=1 Tax=Pseudonocardia thermophila TaxID=1848 RepID=A0A1M6X877_PSETH|nr:hypothetical protein SAMN05443637_11697 [Pseudonocardia thermophila]
MVILTPPGRSRPPRRSDERLGRVVLDGCSPERAVRFLTPLPLSPADRLAVASGNADELMGLKAVT